MNYPRITATKDIVQYEENLFVWHDETGEARGVGSTFEEALRMLKAYASSLDTPPFPADLLHKLADLYAERNAVYKDNFRRVGKVMKALFPDEPPRLETAEDYDRWHLFELSVVKLTRYAVQFNNGGHEDSLHDDIVYKAMVAMLDHEAKEKAKVEVEFDLGDTSSLKSELFMAIFSQDSPRDPTPGDDTTPIGFPDPGF